MQISRTLLLVCAVGCAFFVRGADNEAQMKAREALQKKLSETQPAAQQAPAVSRPPQTPALAQPTTAPAAAVPAAHADAIEKAREAVRLKMQEVGGQPAPVPAVAPLPATPPVRPPQPIAAPAPEPIPAVAPAPAAQAPASPDAIARARELMRQKMQGVVVQEPSQPSQPSQPTAPPIAPAPAPAEAVTAPPPTPAPTPAAVAAPAPGAPVSAEDIARARELMRQKMQGLAVEEPVRPTAPQPPATTPERPAVEAASPAPAPTPPPVATQPAPADPEALAKAREAMRQKLNQIEQQPPSPPTLAAPAPPDATRPSPVVSQPAAPPPSATATVPPSPLVTEPGLDPETAAKAREAVRQTMQQMTSRPAGAVSGANEPRVMRPPAFQSKLSFPPLQGPALGLPAEKQQRLAELLRRYQADEITPEQYHAERAKILAQ